MRHRKEIYAAALEQNGRAVQLAQFYEEVGELLVAVGHHSRGRVDVDAVAVEIADVRIMLEQLEGLCGVPVGRCDELMAEKLDRLAGRLGVSKACRCDAPAVCGQCMKCYKPVAG